MRYLKSRNMKKCTIKITFSDVYDKSTHIWDKRRFTHPSLKPLPIHTLIEGVSLDLCHAVPSPRAAQSFTDTLF